MQQKTDQESCSINKTDEGILLNSNSNYYTSLFENNFIENSNIKAELEQLIKEKSAYKLIADSTLDALVMTNIDGLIVYWNKASEKVFGYNSEEALGQKIYDLIIPQSVLKSCVLMYSNFKTSPNIEMFNNIVEKTLITKEGKEFTAEISFSTINIKNSCYILGAIRDTTQRKQLELTLIKERQSLEESIQARTQELNELLIKIKHANDLLNLQNKKLQAKEEALTLQQKKHKDTIVELKKSEAKYKNLFNNMNEGVGIHSIIYDDSGKPINYMFIDVNQAFETIFHLNKQEFIGKTVTEIFKLERPPMLEAFSKIAIEGGSTYFETYISFLDKHVSINVFSPEINKFAIAINDISERKNSEKMKENFIATLSHDLRVPLLAENHTLKYMIKGSYGKLNEKQTIAAENMLNSNDELIKLVNTLLDVYKYQSKSIELHTEEDNLYNLTHKCISELNSMIEGTNKSIICLISKNIPSVKIDKKLIKRVLTNLIANAINYSSDNCNIEINAIKDNDKLLVSIKDNGKGIPKNELDKIFDLYYTSSKKFRKVGTGLGLYLSKEIINAHGGEIWAESVEKQGSIFYFTLPLC
ncbi:MAG: ATP-binding protein [Cyanobacteriota bacterium]